MTKFKNAQEGDTVYSLTFGEGKVKYVKGETVMCEFPLNNTEYYDLDGYWNRRYITPDLYWDKPRITEVKKKVTKTEKYFGTMADGAFIGLSRKEAPNCKIPVTLTYEIEE